MRLFVFGSTLGEFPELPDEFTEIYLHENYDTLIDETQTLMDWATGQPAPIVLVLPDTSGLSDEQLEEVSELVETDDPEAYMLSLCDTGDVVFMAWEDTDVRHSQLKLLTEKDIGVLDMADKFQNLVMGDTPSAEDMIKEITARVTADVLKTVRAEMQELLRSRRFRSSPPKV